MKKEHKELIVKLSDQLELLSIIFLKKYDHVLDTDGKSIDFIISAHFSSLFNLMKIIAKNNDEIKTKVEDFIENTLNGAMKSDAIVNLEIIENDEIN